LETIKSGDLVVDGQRLGDPATDMPRLRTEIGFVFQQFNLYPHKTALQNVTLAPIHVRRTPRAEAEQAGRELLAKVGLADKGRLLSQPAVRRPAAAGRDRPQPVHAPEDHAVRRADLGARPEMISEVLDVMVAVAEEGMDHDGGDA